MEAVIGEHFPKSLVGAIGTEGNFQKKTGTTMPKLSHSFESLHLGSLQIQFYEDATAGNLQAVQPHGRNDPPWRC